MKVVWILLFTLLVAALITVGCSVLWGLGGGLLGGAFGLLLFAGSVMFCVLFGRRRDSIADFHRDHGRF